MAEKPKSIQEKVTIRPTPIGARVIERLEIPHIDKSGELRRLLELGFAAELAGFSLDGVVLRFGGRVWDLRSELGQNAVVSPMLTAHVPAAAADNQAAETTQPRSNRVAWAPSEAQSGGSPDIGKVADAAGLASSPLLANLRGLSGGS